MPKKYAEMLEQLILADSTLMPAGEEKKLLTVFKISAAAKPVDWPTEYKIRQKMSALKSKLKNQGVAVQ